MSFIDDRAILVKLKSALINKAHGITVRNGIKIPKARLLTNSGFDKYIFNQTWPSCTERELKLIHLQIKSLNDGIKSFEIEIHSAARQMYGYKNLLSIKGIGSLSAAILLAVIGDVSDFSSSKHLCSYFGIVPRIRQSNETNKKCGISKSGSKIGRSTLVQCVWVTIRYNEYLKGFYERIKSRVAPSKAIIACSRKLLTTIYYILKNDWVFDDFSSYRYHIRHKSD